MDRASCRHCPDAGHIVSNQNPFRSQKDLITALQKEGAAAKLSLYTIWDKIDVIWISYPVYSGYFAAALSMSVKTSYANDSRNQNFFLSKANIPVTPAAVVIATVTRSAGKKSADATESVSSAWHSISFVGR